MRILASGFFLLAMLAGFSLTQETDVSGEWDFTMQTPRGERTSTIKIVQDGEKITVTMPGFRGGEVTGEGTIKGNEIEWTITRSTPQGEFTVTYKGTVEGNTMSGTAEMGQMGTVEWSAKKK
ncbi:MAG: hypothetical protein FJY81_04505 [Candidatus Aminicenantes bacterium]|nr:hypothetical protein [Candidatus Aminicenantes bacterium]